MRVGGSQVIGTGVFASVEFDENLLTRGWVLSLMGLGACAAVQLGFLNQTLANSPVSYGVPTYQALLTVITIITGGIFFTEAGEPIQPSSCVHVIVCTCHRVCMSSCVPPQASRPVCLAILTKTRGSCLVSLAV